MIAGNEDGVASVDGLMEPEALCDTVVATLAENLFGAPSERYALISSAKQATTTDG